MDRVRNPNAKIIAFEGPDHSFKSTAFKAFCKKFKQQIHDTLVITQKFPQYESWSGQGVTKWLTGELDRSYIQQYPKSVALLYSFDRIGYWLDKRPDGKRNIDYIYGTDRKVVFIFDRYSMSNALYQPVYTDENGNPTRLEVIREPIELGIPAADVYVLMRASNKDSWLTNISKKEQKDENEKDFSFMSKVWDRASVIDQSMFEDTGTILHIEDIQSPEDPMLFKSRKAISDEIWNKVFPIIRK